MNSVSPSRTGKQLDNSLKSILEYGSDDPLFVEQFNALRAKFEYRMNQFSSRVVAVTSAISGEGKTLSTAKLAINLASNGEKRVLLIDADLRKIDLSMVLGASPTPGLSDYLSESALFKEIVRKTGIDGLYLVPGGTVVKEPMKILSGTRFRELIISARENFDFVILDTPPIIPVGDTLILKDKIDGFIFLFRLDYTPYKFLEEAIEEIGEEKIIGVVLNGVEPERFKYYKRYYGKYYGNIK